MFFNFETIRDFLKATTNRINSPSFKQKNSGGDNVGGDKTVHHHYHSDSTIKLRNSAGAVWENVVANMQEAPFVLEQGIDRAWLSQEISKTKAMFEQNSVYFSPEFKKAFENWFYAFQTAFRTKNLYETNLKKDELEVQIRKIIYPTSDYVERQKQQMDKNEGHQYLNSTK